MHYSALPTESIAVWHVRDIGTDNFGLKHPKVPQLLDAKCRIIENLSWRLVRPSAKARACTCCGSVMYAAMGRAVQRARRCSEQIVAATSEPATWHCLSMHAGCS